MPLIIHRPSSIDVTVNNPNDVIYLKGNEFTDGSHRIIYNPIDDFGNFETRVLGQWVLGPVTFSDAGYVIDGAKGEFIFASPQEAERVRVGVPS